MKISNVGSSKAATSAGRKKKTSAAAASEFANELRGTAETAAATPVESAAVGAVESILSVQEVPDATEDHPRRLAQQYADDVLDRLESIRRDLLTGVVSKEKLVDLAQTLRSEKGKTNDPALKGILDEIELRAKVEIAKLTREF